MTDGFRRDTVASLQLTVNHNLLKSVDGSVAERQTDRQTFVVR